MRILLVGDYPDDPRLGSAKVTHKLREELILLGHECDALSTRHLGRHPSGRQVRQLVAPALAARAIARALLSGNYDVVDVSSAEGLWFGMQKRAGAHRRTAYVCRSHGLEHLNYQRMLGDAKSRLTSKPWPRRIWYPASRLSQVALAARLANRLIVLNPADRAFAVERRWLPQDRIHVVPHGVSTRFIRLAPAGQPRGGGALFCGTWDHVKGVSYLVDAWTRLHDAGDVIPLTVLGPGLPFAQVLDSFPARVRPSVTVIDRLPEEGVIAEYRRHDLLVFPSTYEGFGLAVLEAMSQAMPVVATPVGCAGELVVDDVTGVCVPPRDAVAIANAVRRLMSDAALRERLGAAAAAAVSGMTWRCTAERTLAVYTCALEQIR